MTADDSGIAVMADGLQTDRPTPDSGNIVEYALRKTHIEATAITLVIMRQIQTSIHVHLTHCDSRDSVVEARP